MSQDGAATPDAYDLLAQGKFFNAVRRMAALQTEINTILAPAPVPGVYVATPPPLTLYDAARQVYLAFCDDPHISEQQNQLLIVLRDAMEAACKSVTP